MRQNFFYVYGCLIALSMSSCATLLGGQITDAQKSKPAPGQPKREIRVGALVADIVIGLGIGAVIDFATGAIYKPEKTEESQSQPRPRNAPYFKPPAPNRLPGYKPGF